MVVGRAIRNICIKGILFGPNGGYCEKVAMAVCAMCHAYLVVHCMVYQIRCCVKNSMAVLPHP